MTFVSRFCVLLPTFRAAILLAAVCCVGCSSESEPVTSQHTKYQVAEDSGAAAQPAPEAAPPPGTPREQPPRDELSAAARSAGVASSAPSAVPAVPAAVPVPAEVAVPPVMPSPSAPTEPTVTPPSGTTVTETAPAPLASTDAVPATPVPGAIPSQSPAGRSSEKPDGLLAELENLARQQPSGTTRASLLADMVKIQNTIVQKAEVLLVMNVDGKVQQQAALFKLGALRELNRAGDPDAARRLNDFVAEMLRSKTPEVAQLGRRLSFAGMLQAFESNPSGDAQGVLTEFKKLFAQENKDAVTLEFGNQVASVFERSGNQKEAVEVLKMLAEAYTAVDPALQANVTELNERIRIVEADFQGKIKALETGQPEALEQLVTAATSVLDGKPLGEMSFLVTRSLAQLIESRSQPAAQQVYAKLAAVYANHPAAELGKQAQGSLDLFKRRSALLGQPIVVEGSTVQGTPFNWATYKGKVVLVDFWSSSYLPYLQQVPAVKRIYDQYRDQGFEIVAINLDQDVRLLKEVSALQPLPWVTVISDDPNKRGADYPLVAKCGIESIPFSLLLDRTGAVAFVNPPRNTLEAKIQELLKPSAKP